MKTMRRDYIGIMPNLWSVFVERFVLSTAEKIFLELEQLNAAD